MVRKAKEKLEKILFSLTLLSSVDYVPTEAERGDLSPFFGRHTLGYTEQTEDVHGTVCGRYGKVASRQTFYTSIGSLVAAGPVK